MGRGRGRVLPPEDAQRSREQWAEGAVGPDFDPRLTAPTGEVQNEDFTNEWRNMEMAR